jgi:AraC-like DNA-binding protein
MKIDKNHIKVLVKNTAENDFLTGLNSQTKPIHVSEAKYFVKITNSSNETDTIFKKIDKEYIQFYFCVKGKVVLNFGGGDRKIVVEKDEAFFLYDAQKEWELGLNLVPSTEFFVFGLSVQYITKIFMKNKLDIQALNRVVTGLFYYRGKLSPSIKSIFTQIEENEVMEGMKAGYTDAKLQELFILYFSKINAEQVQCPVRQHNPDLIKVKKAHDLLMENLIHPPSKSELASKVELSEYKLSKGFKEIYGENMYDYVLNEKLDLSKQILQTQNKKILEVATEIGYENPSHFIAAFKKKYGFTPKQLLIKK